MIPSQSVLIDGQPLPFLIGTIANLPTSRWLAAHDPPSDTAIDSFREEHKTEISRDEALSLLYNDFATNNSDRAALLLSAWKAAYRGEITPLRNNNNRLSVLRGAANYNDVTCYIDSLLVAMFSRMDNFTPLLYPQTFNTIELRLLSVWLRLYVNLLRQGECVSADLVRGLLAAFAGAGWGDGAGGPLTMQQDAAELFQFVTERLCMPMLSLNVQIAHAGRVDKNDDFKTVQEQLLYLPVPGSDADPPLLLEECLELFFASNIMVDRHLDRDDRPPLPSSPAPPIPETRPRRQSYSIMPTQPLHGRLGSPGGSSSAPVPIGSNRPSTPPQSTMNMTVVSQDSPAPETPGKEQAGSSQRRSSGQPPTYLQLYGENATQTQQKDLKDRLWTSNNLVSFPAWMCLQLMPFYAESKHLRSLENVNARQVAAHFTEARPVLAFCLKRYFWDEDGRPQRNNRHVIVPEVIHLPSFVADDSDKEQAFGSFKLVLESVVFHKGANTHSGHYTTLTSELVYPEVYSLATPTTANPTLGRLFRNKSKRKHSHSNPNIASGHSKDAAAAAAIVAATAVPVSSLPTSSGTQSINWADQEDGSEFPSTSHSTTPETFADSSISLQHVHPIALPTASGFQNGHITTGVLSKPQPLVIQPRRRWLYCDCSAPMGEKVTEMDLHRAMEANQPYLLFYRMVALEPSLDHLEPPVEAPRIPAKKSILSRPKFLRGKHNEYARQYREEKCIIS